MAAFPYTGLLSILILLHYGSNSNTVEARVSKDMTSKRFFWSPYDVHKSESMYVRSVGTKDEGLPNTRIRRSKQARRQKRPGYDISLEFWLNIVWHTGESDVVFLVDKSSNIDSTVFAKQLKFIEELLGYLPVFPAKIRVACVSISSQGGIEFNFKEYINKECVIKGIKNIKFTGGKYDLGQTLNLIHESLIFDKVSGARPNAQKIIVVFTNGNLDNIWRTASNRLKEKGVAFLGISLTKRVNQYELASLASKPKYAFYIGNIDTFYQLIALLGGDEARSCRPGQIVFDKCQRRCRCVDGKLVDCCRVRKQFTEMSVLERTRYIEVVKIASMHPAHKEKYEKFLTTHKTLFNTGIHQAQFFLPWHRWFLLEYENFLREIDCSVTVPYWESIEEANNALASDLWNSEAHGFGGNGTGQSNCVKNGPFREGEWFMLQSAGGGCLKRNFSGRFPDCLAVRDAFLEFANVSEFESFEAFLHREFHDAVHCVIGGHMCSVNSASCPEFFLHHGFVDKLWQDWQKQSRQHTMNEHFMSQTTKMPSNEYFSRDLLNSKKQPGCVCAEYRDPSDEIYKTVNTLSKIQVKDIARMPLPPYPENAKRLFQLSGGQMERLEKIRVLLQPVKVLRGDELEGKDRILGFRIKDIGNEIGKVVFRRSAGNNEETYYNENSDEDNSNSYLGDY